MLPEGDESPLQTGSPMHHFKEIECDSRDFCENVFTLTISVGRQHNSFKEFKELIVGLNQEHFPV